MTNIYNFNISVEVPQKTVKEQKLFEKWMPILKMKVISDEQIKEYKKDLLTLTTALLFATVSFSQSSIVTAGNETETIGEVFPLMQQVDTIIQVSLSVPKYEIEQPKVQVKKKITTFEKIIGFFKRIFNIK